MSESVQAVDQVSQEKERNFVELRKIAESERSARMALEERLAAIENASQHKINEDDDDDDPYVDKKKLNKKLTEFGQKTSEIVQKEVQKAIYEERKQNWFKNNPDFQRVMTPELINKLEQVAPDLAQGILSVPDEFERQKLAYTNIKALKLDMPALKEPSVQEKIDQNRKSPFYQPSGMGTSPYSQQGDFSESGQKNAWEKMQSLKKNMRLG